MGKNKTGKYLKYAVGEIALVVIGILIALQINNQNELRKQKLVEIDILEGIRNDILQDTIDIVDNINFYDSIIVQHDFFIDVLINKKKLTKELENHLCNLPYSDRILTLHESHFQEAKSKGLSIISSKYLKQEISRLYEWEYKNLLFMENSWEMLSYAKTFDIKIGKYCSLDSTGINISDSNYEILLSDSNAIYNLENERINQDALLRRHRRILEIGLNIVEIINEELIELKE